jgi:hypothetical protein
MLCSYFILSLMLPCSVAASQVYGHLYFAEALLKSEAGSYLDLQNHTRAAFLLGSLSPDSAWIGHMLTQPEVRARLMHKYAVKFPNQLQEHASYIAQPIFPAAHQISANR